MVHPPQGPDNHRSSSDRPPAEVSPLSRGTIVSAPIRLNRHVSDVVDALAACISFAVGAAETSHPAAGEEMYEAGATETVKAPAPAPKRRTDEGIGLYKRLIIRGATLIDGTGLRAGDPGSVALQDADFLQRRQVFRDQLLRHGAVLNSERVANLAY